MDLRDLLPEPRPVEDVLARRIRLVIDGEATYLPVLTIGDARAWTESPVYRAVRRAFLIVTQEAGRPEVAIPALAKVVETAPGAYLAFLRSYDLSGVLPSDRRLAGAWSVLDLLDAILEVWRAAHPASRHRGKRDPDEVSDVRVVAAYEMASFEWGWDPAYIETLTDELFVHLMDAATDRHKAQFEDRVEAGRLAAIFSSGKAGASAYQRWLRRAKRSASLTGQSLEQAIGAFAFAHPEYVVEGAR